MSSPAAPAQEDRVSGLAIGVLVVILVAGFTILPRLFPDRGSALQGQDAPELSLPIVANAPAGGSALTLSGLKGHPVLLDFWATWCGPCRKEVPIVNGIAQRYGEQGLEVIGVNTSDQSGNAAGFAKSHHLTFPIAFDEEQRAATAFGVDTLPTLVVISKTGKILAVRIGETSDSELDALVKRAL
jgi:cytochrome c biogenesis protein CcmG/thiol:disulfide interchange protein DsbE